MMVRFAVETLIVELVVRRNCLSVLCLGLSIAVAHADPFAWDQATVTHSTIQLENGTDLAVRSGHLSQGAHVEIAITVGWSVGEDVSFEQELVNEMADSAPSLRAQGDVIVSTWMIHPIGTDEGFSVEHCWRLDNEIDRFVEVDCPRP